MLKNFLYSKQQVQDKVQNVPKMVKYIKMPFYGKVSFQYKKMILPILKSKYPAVNFRFVFTNDLKLGSFFRMKDRIHDSMCSNVVYKFSCPSCNARYIGCSTRAFKIRVFEHMGKSFRTGQWLNKMPFSAIRSHSHAQDHPFSEKDFTILGKFRSEGDAFISEKLLISKMNPELNCQS